MNNYRNYGNYGNCGNRRMPGYQDNGYCKSQAKPECENKCHEVKPECDCKCKEVKPMTDCDCKCQEVKPVVDCDCKCSATKGEGICGVESMYQEMVKSDACGCNDMPGKALAMAYVPWQSWKNLYEICEGFSKGTIFKELDLDFYGRRCS